uniref:Uncharacterized protein TCIL3000_11_15030 n=1 Tax=Trypanosoma congolense (strain IL3000) TaxID=1068625 RepID=G0V2W3_TRYCI|nr:unnamed protein product [Trypanosoma congolense IL3000]
MCCPYNAQSCVQMAQHPRKLLWREEVPYGLSASQFGMALGLCGRVVDYVKYLRDIIGTELEFTGNVTTEHGVVTEPKSRSLYELLTGTAVSDGGFYVTEDRVLGCSPDGRIFEDAPQCQLEQRVLSQMYGCTGPKTSVSVRIPFRSMTERNVDADVSPLCSAGSLFASRPSRLLEIKSPFYALYDSTKRLCSPFGFPQQYMCQMQGQMAISNVDVCDFFVFLDHPTCQVVAWRVYRSTEFWNWARPKLLKVVEWIRDGPPDWLTRKFEFEAFDFSKIDVEPLVFPYNITMNTPILDDRRFPFFAKYTNPYVSTQRTAAQDAMLHILSSPLTRFLFDSNDAVAEYGDDQEDGSELSNQRLTMWFTTDQSTAVPFLSSCDALSMSAATSFDDCQGELLCIYRPLSFEEGILMCRVYSPGIPVCCDDKNGCNICLRKLRFYERELLSRIHPIMIPTEVQQSTVHSMAYSAASNGDVHSAKPRELSIESAFSIINIDEDSDASGYSSVEVIGSV